MLQGDAQQAGGTRARTAAAAEVGAGQMLGSTTSCGIDADAGEMTLQWTRTEAVSF